MRALSVVSSDVPQASIFTWREGCARCRWGLLEMVDILDTFVSSCARASLDFFSVEVAARSEGLASVNGASGCARGPN